ncbi:serine hydrolase domain-containing protein [Aquisalinus flavus]|nr:serine hydrolase domain-containing protein [Aquisalinus flavus]MBD0426075.1 beta-lactamase family protein [Aquisalinus flavus]
MTKLLLTLVALFAIASQPDQTVDGEIADVEKLTVSRLNETGGLGVVFTLIDEHEIKATRAFGQANTRGDAISAEMIFAAASMTKPVTAVSILQLEHEGKVDLDAPVSRYLPWFVGHEPKLAVRIRVRDLLNHRSGFSRASGVRNGMLAGDIPTEDPDKFRRIVNATRLVHQPGDTFEYSNLNFHLLGQIIEAVTGETYANYIEASVFSPLGLSASNMNSLPRGHASAGQHRMIFGMPVALKRDRAIAGAAGGLFTTTDDYARFLIAVATEDERLLPSGTLARILSEPSGAYRLGWQIAESSDHGTIIFHNGWAFGGSSTGGIAPATGRGFVSMTNAAEGYIAGDTPAITDHPRALAFGNPVGKPRSFWFQRGLFATVILLAVAHLFWFWHLSRDKSRPHAAILIIASGVQATAGLAMPLLLPRLFAGDFRSTLDLYPTAATALLIAGAAMIAVSLMRFKGLRSQELKRLILR